MTDTITLLIYILFTKYAQHLQKDVYQHLALISSQPSLTASIFPHFRPCLNMYTSKETWQTVWKATGTPMCKVKVQVPKEDYIHIQK